jgi:hypothetical protein
MIDPYNHTGYAQVFKEINDSGDDRAFAYGLDAVSQSAVSRTATVH